ncbi:hypothetical protein [Williamsia limnetica]|nr:hypothetical protein [Williamsia limnetica]
MLTYLHKQKSPGSKEGPQWYVSMTGSLPDQDLGVTLMIQRAVSSLWSVSRRRYTAEPGEVYIMTPLGVQDAIYAPIAASLNVVRTLGLELPKQDLDGEIIRGQEHELYGEHVPKGWIEAKKGDFRESEIKLIHLPVRQKDKRPINPSRRSLLPFSPDGSSRV